MGDASEAVVAGRRASRVVGQSPGAKGQPLHVMHTVLLVEDDQGYDAASPVVTEPFRFLRVLVLRPAMGWGVSLWQLDLIGFEVT